MQITRKWSVGIKNCFVASLICTVLALGVQICLWVWLAAANWLK